MQYTFDLVLILVSGTACLYCWFLNRRLRALQDVKSGLGSSINSLTMAVNRTAIAAQEAKNSAAGSAAQLRDLLAEVEKCAPRVEEMIENVDMSSRSVVREIRQLQDDIRTELGRANQEANVSAKRLLEIVEIVNEHTKALHTQYAQQPGQAGMKIRSNRTANVHHLPLRAGES